MKIELRVFERWGIGTQVGAMTFDDETSAYEVLKFLLDNNDSKWEFEMAWVSNGEDIDYIESSKSLNDTIINTANSLNIPLKIGKTITSDVFDLYSDSMEKFKSNFPEDDYLATEMEAFGLFYMAFKFKREATCLLTVVDSCYDKNSLTSEEREKSLDQMITLALEAAIM